RGEPLVAQAPFLEGARAEILDDHVGAPRDAAHDLLSLGQPQVGSHRLLVAVLHVPPQRGALVELAPLAQGIAAGRLDLDHLGAEIGEELAGEGAGDELSQLDDLDAFQGFHTGRRSTTACASVPVSTNSSSPPTGTPRAIRVTRRPRPLSISPM